MVTDRPLERRTAARTAVVWDAVRGLLDAAGPVDGASGDGLRVLDIGGGTGGLAVRVASRGHHVTVVDPSPDALAALARRADEDGVADRVAAVQGDLESIGELAAGFDLVLCHEVLGLVPDADASLHALARVLRPGGTLSLLVAQRHAAVLSRAMAGHFAQARQLLAPTGSSGPAAAGPRAERRFTVSELHRLLPACGLQVREVRGVRVFADLVPSSVLDLETGAAAALLELEQAVAADPDYFTLASQLHVSATVD